MSWTINESIFSFVAQKIVYFWNWLDAISIGGLFSMLDLGIAFILAGTLLPAVLNLFNNATSSGFAGFYSRDFDKKGG